MRDQVRGRGEDVARRAIIALQPNDFGAGKIVVEAQDIVDLSTPPAIDRLIVVADAADVFGVRLRLGRRHSGMRALLPRPACGERGRFRKCCVRGWLSNPLTRIASQSDLSPQAGRGKRRRLRQQPQPQILCDVGVLIFVHQNEFEAVLVLPEYIGMFAEQPDVFQQEIAEIGGVEDFQPLLINCVKLAATAVAEYRGFARRHLRRRQPTILPAVDQSGQHARRPALVVDVVGL